MANEAPPSATTPSKAQGAPALGLRVLRAAPTRLVLELVAVGGTIPLVRWLWTKIPPFAGGSKAVGFAIFTAMLVPAVIAVYVALVRVLERRRVSELSRRGALREVGAGLFYGAALFSATIGIIALLGGYRVVGTEPPRVLLASIAMGVESGFVEEIVIRGVLFRILEEWLGTWAALVLSSALFGCAHLGNPHATAWSALAIALEAGTLLGAAYMLTGRLWLAIGLHAAWNYTQGAIFGVAVSGNEMTGVLRGVVSGPRWLSGGEFGAESSIVAVVACGSLATWFLGRVVRSGRVKAPSWRRGPTSAV